jgi:hypothetical protein
MSKARDLANAGTALGAVTATELGYVDGVTSAIQTQIDTKEATLPSQTGNSGKYLTTNGTAKSWGTVSQYALPTQTGNSGKYLTTDGTAESWGTVAAAPATNWTLLNTGGTALSGTTTTISGISGKDKLMIVINDAYPSTSSGYFYIQFNSDTANHYQYGAKTNAQDTWSPYSIPTNYGAENGGGIYLGYCPNTSAGVKGYVQVTGCNSTGAKVFTSVGGVAGQSQAMHFWTGGYYLGTSTISSVSIKGPTMSTSGYIYVYASA